MATVNTSAFALPPSSVRNIGDALLEKDISWRYYGAHWNRYVPDPDYADPTNVYCDICNPFQYSTSIMTNEAVRTAHLKDTLDFYADVSNGYLPAVSILKPDGLVDGHPASSKLDLFEGFSKKVIDAVMSHPSLWKDTVHLRHVRRRRRLLRLGLRPAGRLLRRRDAHPADRGFTVGDGRSPLARLRRSRLDPEVHRAQLEPQAAHAPQPRHLPNPIATHDNNPWVPRNSPALDDLFDLFDFGHHSDEG